MGKQKNNKKSSYPPNISVNYYTDPIFSTDAFYGFDHEGHEAGTDKGADEKDSMRQSLGEENPEPIDEPVESWGWINNIDNRHI